MSLNDGAAAVETLCEVMEIAATSVQLEPFLQKSSAMICKKFGFDTVKIYKTRYLSNGSIELANLDSSFGDPLTIREPLCEKACQDKKVVSSNQPGFLVAIPLVGLDAQKVMAVIQLSCAEQKSLSPTAMEFLQKLASKLSLVLGRIENQTKTDHQRARVVSNSKLVTLREMSAGIAHEINNPLSVLAGNILLIDKELRHKSVNAEKVREWLGTVSTMIDRITNILMGLRNFSKTASDDPMVKTRVTEIVRDTLSLCSERLKARQIELRMEVPPEVSLTCRPVQLSQILMSLISNAFEAVQKHNEKWIEISALEVGSKVQIIVTDSGPRIAPEVGKAMMQPFFTTKELGSGSGLGLSVSRNMVEEFGGQLYYVPEHPNTRFVIELPIEGVAGV